jgi:hypothetical protein
MAKGRPYAQLNPEQQIHFGQCRLTIMVLENATSDEVRDMFLRLQNGTPLNAEQKWMLSARKWVDTPAGSRPSRSSPHR